MVPIEGTFGGVVAVEVPFRRVGVIDFADGVFQVKAVVGRISFGGVHRAMSQRHNLVIGFRIVVRQDVFQVNLYPIIFVIKLSPKL